LIIEFYTSIFFHFPFLNNHKVNNPTEVSEIQPKADEPLAQKIAQTD
jgi:hypothetical protein